MWHVWRKEILEISRDKKTLFFMIALPLLIFPVIMAVVIGVTAHQTSKAQEQVLKLAFIGEEYAPKFAEKVHFNKSFDVIEIALESEVEIKQAIRRGEVDVVVQIPDDFREQERTQRWDWSLYYNDSSQINFVDDKISKVLTTYNQELRGQAMEALGIAPGAQQALLKPVALKKVDVAEKRENLGEKLGGFIPYLLIPLCLTGAMYPALQMGVGEKERGTLETLLLAPVSRTSLVIGKLLTSITAAAVGALVTIFSFGLWAGIATSFFDAAVLKEILGSIQAFELVLMLMMLLPLCVMFSAIVLALSIYAKSFKEAQNYMGPLSILVFVPVMFSLLPGVKLEGFWAWVPVSNVALAMKELLKGTMDLWMLLPIFGSTLILAAGLVYFCIQWFCKEEVLFR